MARDERARQTPGMVKRTIAAVLWFVSGWYLGAMLAYILGISAVLGPILGISLAVVIGVDPLHRIWETQSRERVEARLADLVAERQF